MVPAVLTESNLRTHGGLHVILMPQWGKIDPRKNVTVVQPNKIKNPLE